MRRLALGLVVAAPVVVVPLSNVVAQPTPVHGRHPAWDSSAEPTDEGPPRAATLRARTGVELAERLLASSQEANQMRGVRRLGSTGTAPALESLIQWLDGGARSSRVRLVVVRALAPHVGRTNVQSALTHIMTGVGSSARPGEPLETEVRRSAALALALGGERGALTALAAAIRHEGPTAEAAAAALEAHPPVDLDVILGARGAPTVSLVRLLARLGDQRAFHTLRGFVRRAPPVVRARAAVALTGLGDLETVALARHWLAQKESTPLRLAGAEILAIAHSADAAAAIAKLLGDDDTREQALALAERAPHVELVPALNELLTSADGARAARVIGVIGRAGGQRAAALLGQQLARPERAAAAAYALALSAGDAATAQLETALRSPALRRLAARAAVVRELALGQPVPGTRDALSTLLRASDSAADRAAGAWGLAALDAERAAELLSSDDPWIVRAAARCAVEAGAAEAATRRLARETDPITRTALGTGLAVPAAADEVPTRVLIELIESGDAAAPLAARTLAARDSAELRPRIEALLQNPDALLRAHAALGLAQSSDPSAVGLLQATYRLEPDAQVRHAVMVALSQRSEPTRLRTLRLAAGLDADEGVREAARLGLSGQRLVDLAPGPSAFWLSLVPNTKAARPETPIALLGTSTGLALPLVADPDGLVVATGLPSGPVRLRLVVAPARTPAQKK